MTTCLSRTAVDRWGQFRVVQLAIRCNTGHANGFQFFACSSRIKSETDKFNNQSNSSNQISAATLKYSILIGNSERASGANCPPNFKRINCRAPAPETIPITTIFLFGAVTLCRLPTFYRYDDTTTRPYITQPRTSPSPWFTPRELSF